MLSLSSKVVSLQISIVGTAANPDFSFITAKTLGIVSNTFYDAFRHFPINNFGDFVGKFIDTV
jgi:hypothetical protein